MDNWCPRSLQIDDVKALLKVSLMSGWHHTRFPNLTSFLKISARYTKNNIFRYFAPLNTGNFWLRSSIMPRGIKSCCFLRLEALYFVMVLHRSLRARSLHSLNLRRTNSDLSQLRPQYVIHACKVNILSCFYKGLLMVQKRTVSKASSSSPVPIFESLHLSLPQTCGITILKRPVQLSHSIHIPFSFLGVNLKSEYHSVPYQFFLLKNITQVL